MTWLTKNENLVALMLWFGSMTVVYAGMPDIATIAYIIMFPILILSEIIRRQEHNKRLIRISLIDGLICLYFLYVGISIITSHELPLPITVYSIEFLLNIVAPVTIYWYLRLKPLSSTQIKYWAYLFAIIIVIQSILGYISLRHPFLLPEIYQPRPHLLYTRGSGTFISPEGYVITLLFGMAFVFYRSIATGSIREKWLLRVILLIGGCGTLFSQNRAGWLNLLVLIAVMCYLDRSIIKWIFSTFVIGIVAVLLINPQFVTMTIGRLQGWREIESRIIMNVAGVRMAIAKPMTGWGYASYDLHDWKYMQAVGPLQPTRYELAQATSHNMYLTILAETGLIGFFLYMSPTLYWLAKSLRILRNKLADTKTHKLLFVMWTQIVMVHLAGQFADMRFFPFVLGYWWLALAIIANSLRTVQNRDSVSVQDVSA